ncbi:MAG TPA: hypothetical protein VL461_00190 [Dictyobacter sp.]|jgi:hypothetical protein|nr:hypothetical protein [Dictyobacter sp.]
MYHRQHERPVGVTVVAILLAILGVLGVIGFFNSLILSGSNGTWISLSLLDGIIAVLEIVLAWGLWTLKPWAFWTTVVILVLDMVSAIVAYTTSANTLALFAGLVIPIILLLYLFFDRAVRSAFRVHV